MSWANGYFAWVVTALSVLGVVLNIKKMRVCFWIWAFTNGSWAVIDFAIGAYSQAVLFTIYFGLAIYGLVEWKR